MDCERLTKNVFHLDFIRRRTSNNWISDIYKVFTYKLDIYENIVIIVFASWKPDLYEIEKNNWKNNIFTIPKLRTYCTFNENYETEPVVYKVYNMAHISLLDQSKVEFCHLR